MGDLMRALGAGLIVIAAACWSAVAQPPEPQLMHPVLLHDDGDLALFARCPTQKVLPDEELSAAEGLVRAQRIELAAARNESEQVQLVLRPARELTGLDLSFGELTGPGAIPADAWSWDRVACTHVRRGSYHYGMRTNQSGLLPDPLEPAGRFEAPADTNTTLLLRIEVPADAPPGDYAGIITLSGDGLALQVPVALTVWDITLPAEHRLANFTSTVERSPEGFRRMRELDVNSLKYGAASIGITRADDGTLQLDFGDYDAELALLLDELGFYSIGVPPSMPLTSGGPRDSYLSTGVPVGSDEFWPLFEQYMRAVGDHLRERGYADRVVWKVGDELPEDMFPLTAEMCRRAKAVWPELRIVLTTNFMSDELAEVLDIWVPGWHLFAVRADAPEEWDRRRRAGMQMWAYLNSAYMLNAEWNPGAMRLFPAALAKYGFTGALWWSLRSYGGRYGDDYQGEPDPWTEIRPLMSRSADKVYYDFGNGHLLYPPREHDPQWRSSLRWEAFREGMDEFDLLTLLGERWQAALDALGVEAASGEPWSAEVAVRGWGGTLATGFRLQTYRADATWVHRFRQLVAHEIEALQSGPPLLVSVRPQGALLATVSTVRRTGSDLEYDSPAQATISGLCSAGSTVTVAGAAVEVAAEGDVGRFSHTIDLAPGANLVTIEVTTPDGATNSVYRELRFVPPEQ